MGGAFTPSSETESAYLTQILTWWVRLLCPQWACSSLEGHRFACDMAARPCLCSPLTCSPAPPAGATTRTTRAAAALPASLQPAPSASWATAWAAVGAQQPRRPPYIFLPAPLSLHKAMSLSLSSVANCLVIPTPLHLPSLPVPAGLTAILSGMVQEGVGAAVMLDPVDCELGSTHAVLLRAPPRRLFECPLPPCVGVHPCIPEVHLQGCRLGGTVPWHGQGSRRP